MKYLFYFLLFWQLSYSQNISVLEIGQQLIYEKKHEKAILYFNEQLRTTNDANLKAELLLGLAEIYKLELNFNTSNSYYIRAFQQIKKTKNYQLEFLYYVKMAEFYRKRALLEQAIVQLDKASSLLKKHTITEVNLAKYYSRKAALSTEYYHNADSTLFYAYKSMKIAERINDKDNVFYSKLEIAGVHDRQKNYKKSIKEFEELIGYAKKNNLVQHCADVYINYTRALISDKQLDKALIKSLEALEHAKKHDLLYNKILSTIDIYNLYKVKNNLNKANEYLEYRLQLSEKYYKLEHNKYLFELEEKYKVAEKETQIAINKLELAKKSDQLANNKTKLSVVLGLFFFMILIVILIAYFLRKSNSTNKKLKFLSQQNEFLLSEANHRINNNLQLIIILITAQISKVSENESEEINKILKKINSIATLHRHLYQSGDKRKVDSYKYLKDIQISFADVFLENQIRANFKIETIQLSADVSMYLGLLLTELCMNSIKHAFETAKNKEINFTLKKENDSFEFYYSDNGDGILAEDCKPKLVDKICRQLRTDYKIKCENGFHFSFEKNLQ